mmetsp:Transcript_32817/g.47375  ORF Transcript_32817/g.47375 Transcript_32817/m.47375 type:complete len:212 (-) Transcript_32817:193-828(-)
MFITLVFSISVPLVFIALVQSYSNVGNSIFRRSCFLTTTKIYSDVSQTSDESSLPKPTSKGFGSAKKVAVPEVEKDAGTKTYESQAKRGVPEYNIFLRPTNGTEVEWVPVGSMTIPRDTKVSTAVFEVEEELLKGTFKLYPKLKAFYDVRKDKDGIFEYGYCLKAFPDEPIRVIEKEVVEEKNFFTSWLGKITNPIDTTDLKNPGQMTIKQ